MVDQSQLQARVPLSSAGPDDQQVRPQAASSRAGVPVRRSPVG
ncbi:hypothetical protein [Streptomyces sp. NPDC003635]